MKIPYLSDLHTEIPDGMYVPIGLHGPVAVFAGDILNGPEEAATYFESVLLENPDVEDIVYVLGNHEMWHLNWDNVVERYTNALEKMPNVHLLERDSVVLQGVRFVGTTMWSDFRGGQFATAARIGIKDYKNIHSGAEDLLDTFDVERRFVQNKKWLKGALAEQFDGPTVVVTHHAPSFMSLSEEFCDKPLAGAYASNLEGIMGEYSPKVWIHGHTHRAVDYEVYDTRVVCNARGYYGYGVNPHFSPRKYVEV